MKASEFQIPYVVTPLPGLIEQAILHVGATVSTDMTPRSFATAIINSVKLGPDIPWQDSEELSWISQMRAFVTKLDLV